MVLKLVFCLKVKVTENWNCDEAHLPKREYILLIIWLVKNSETLDVVSSKHKDKIMRLRLSDKWKMLTAQHVKCYKFDIML